MSFLVVHLSDIHFRSKSNPALDRIDQLVAAIASLAPRPQSCLVLVTGDVAWSAQATEYKCGKIFFDALLEKLGALFPTAPSLVFIPGNHDCVLPEENVSVRKLLIDGLQTTLQTLRPDMGILKEVLTAQDNYENFSSHYRPKRASEIERLFNTSVFNFSEVRVRVNAYNTALLSQRKEVPGSLSVPVPLLERMLPSPEDANLTISVYHHPLNWLEPNVRRSFRKLLEASTHLILTGHEHERDARLERKIGGDSIVYIEAEALQDENYPKSGGFNCLIVDTTDSSVKTIQFRWKGSLYIPGVNPLIEKLDLGKKSTVSFTNNDRFGLLLAEDDFGFTHSRKTKLLLDDIFVYPSVTMSSEKAGGNPHNLVGPQLFEFFLKQKHVQFQGSAISGKTALLKTIYKDLLAKTSIVPVSLSGGDIKSASIEDFFEEIWKSFRNQYSTEVLDHYKQRPSEKRALLIDDWHKCRLQDPSKQSLLEAVSQHFSFIAVTSNELTSLSEVLALASGKESKFTLRSGRLKEFSASGRGAIIDKWMRIALPEDVDEQLLSRDIEQAQGVLDYLIGKKTLPSLPYLILGVLQARQSQNQEMSDPGSFGFLVQKLVLDALSLTRGPRKLIDRKDAILRRVSFLMFEDKVGNISENDFRNIVSSYSEEVKVKVDADDILSDLLYARVFVSLDGNLTYTYYHFYFYFLAKHFIDEIEGPRASEIRGHLNEMADRPLAKSNQQTLIFFLFFKKRDPIIDRLIEQANATFGGFDISDMVSDTAFLDIKAPALADAKVDASVDTGKERQKRLEAQDHVESAADNSKDQSALDIQYDDALNFAFRNQFANARLELLGQVIRNFPGTLDGDKKVEILDAAFRLGLRSLHAVLLELQRVMQSGMEQMATKDGMSGQERLNAEGFVRNLVALFVRACCDSRLLLISRAVGVADLEQAYDEALSMVGNSASTRLIDLAIRLDHSDGFPFRDVQRLQKSLPIEAKVAHAVLTDLVVRHTQIFKLKPATLRSIAGLISVDPLSLVDRTMEG